MTQDEISFLRSQNWYPALVAYRLATYGCMRDYAEGSLYWYVSTSLGWGNPPQGYIFWHNVNRSLIERR